MLDRQDEPQSLDVRPATNATGAGWSGMLALLEFPRAGCWQVTANYVHVGIAQELTFVVEILAE